MDQNDVRDPTDASLNPDNVDDDTVDMLDDEHPEDDESYPPIPNDFNDSMEMDESNMSAMTTESQQNQPSTFGFEDGVSSDANPEAIVGEAAPSAGEFAVPEKPKIRAKVEYDIEKVVEYEWPLKSNEKWFIQEQIADLLDVKSFKRKYPELTRHDTGIEEREYLVHNHNLKAFMNEYQICNLVAIRSVEVLELLSSEYPDVYTRYKKVLAERMKQRMLEKQKELELLKNDKKKLEMLRKKAMHSARDYNAEINAHKKDKHYGFVDIQTSIAQYAKNRYMSLPPSVTKPSRYPCNLISSQFKDSYLKWSPDDLRRMPLTTVTDFEYLFPPNRVPSPPPIALTAREKDILERLNEAASISPEGTGSKPSSPATGVPLTPQPDLKPTLIEVKPATIGGSATKGRPLSPRCKHCGKPVTKDGIKCSSCHSSSHPDCASLSEEMARVARNYNWNCMDCKSCTICTKVDNEDSMICCDGCDRGYHTFCVGLSDLPTGKFYCKKYCNRSETPNRRSSTVDSNSSVRRSVRDAKPMAV